MRAITEGTSSYSRTARGTESPISTSSNTMAHNGGITCASETCWLGAPTLEERYEAVKSRLADQHGTDRKAYTDGKMEVVKELLAEFG